MKIAMPRPSQLFPVEFFDFSKSEVEIKEKGLDPVQEYFDFNESQESESSSSSSEDEEEEEK